MKRFLAVILCLILLLTCLSGCSKKNSAISVLSVQNSASTLLAHMFELKNEENASKYIPSTTNLANTARSQIANGEFEIAVIPITTAALIYKKAEPKIKVLAGISVGGLELVATRSIKDLSELKGQTVYLTERGTLVELLLKYLVNLYGIDPFNELSFEYATDNIELINMLSENEASFALFSSADANYVKANVENLSSYNLTDEFAKKFKNPSIVDYCVIATEDFIKENPKATNQLIKDIEASVKKSSDISKTLRLAKNQKLLTRDYTEEFLTSCKADFICGEQMQKKISAYCNLLFKIKRSLIGGEVPKDDFYYVSQNL